MIANLIIRFCLWLSRKTPPRVITGLSAADVYLTRYFLVGGDREEGMSERKGGRRFGLYLHHFHRGDNDRELHNHPWAWGLSLILKGGYREERRAGPIQLPGGFTIGHIVRREVRPWSFNLLRGEDFHRVDMLDGEAWTLFLSGPVVQGWGFWSQKTGRFTPWKVFLGLACLMLSGCLGSDYQVHADVGISIAVVEAARAAAADWMAHVPVRISVDGVPCAPSMPAGSVCLHPTETGIDLPWEPGNLTGFTAFGDMWLNAPALEAEDATHRQRLLAHELGHAMGLLHTGPGTLMYPYADGGALTVTPADVAQWYAVRGETAP